MGKILLLLLCLVISGCGTAFTAFNHDKESPTYMDNKIYSGVKAGYGGHAAWDMPFSLVADTVLLPYTIPATIIATSNNDNEEEQNSQEELDNNKNLGVNNDR